MESNGANGMTVSELSIIPVAGALGAEVSGVDIGKPLSDVMRQTLTDAYLKYHVLFFRDQSLSPKQQLAFTRTFGQPDTYPFMTGMKEAPQVIEIIKTKDESVNFGGSWHSDTAYMPEPHEGTVLYAVSVPEFGGDTLFTNTAAAYDALSDGMKALLDGVVGVYDSDHGYGGSRQQTLTRLNFMQEQYDRDATHFVSEHPIIRTHPVTGRKALYVSRGHTSHLRAMRYEESRPLIEYLSDFVVRPEFTCRFRWAPGSVAVWDNRLTQHYAVNDYDGARRHMRRVTTKGTIPL